MDLRQWDAWRDVFTDDLEFFIENSRVPESDVPTFVRIEAMLEYLSASPPSTISIHQGHMPEIELVDDNTATGIWPMDDWVDEPDRAGAWQGDGHYHERYRRYDDGHWRIASVHLTRLRRNVVPLKPSERNPLLEPGVRRSVVAPEDHSPS
jgi:hypothetical protein